MRFYLDTNILAFLTGQDRGDSIGDDIQMLLNDYSVDILASASAIKSWCICFR